MDRAAVRLPDRRVSRSTSGRTMPNLKRPSWNATLQALVLVRLGQELGTDSRLARAVHDCIEIVLAVIR